jgi:hypothetical protein
VFATLDAGLRRAMSLSAYWEQHRSGQRSGQMAVNTSTLHDAPEPTLLYSLKHGGAAD